MESWVISLVIAVSGVIGTYAVLRHRVASLESELKEHRIEDGKHHEKETAHHDGVHKDFLIRFDAGFKKLDTMIERVVIMEQNTKDHLNLREAEDKFVSHKELQLHLNNIENSMKHIEENSKTMTGKLDELTRILSTNIVRTLSMGESK